MILILIFLLFDCDYEINMQSQNSYTIIRSFNYYAKILEEKYYFLLLRRILEYNSFKLRKLLSVIAKTYF